MSLLSFRPTFASLLSFHPSTPSPIPPLHVGEEGTIPGIEKQVQGLEKLEIDAMKAGKESPFQQSGPLSGPFGTPENPVKVPSSYSNRIVGCVVGTGESAHDLLWHEVRENDTTICLSCGQAFTLEKVE